MAKKAVRNENRVKALEEYLKNQGPFYKNIDTITQNEIDILRGLPAKTTEHCFPCYVGDQVVSYTLHLECPECKKHFVLKYQGKVRVLNLVRERGEKVRVRVSPSDYGYQWVGINPNLCDSCRQKKKTECERLSDEQEEKAKQIAQERKDCMALFLDANHQFSEDVKGYARWNSLVQTMGMLALDDKRWAVKTLKALPYSDFLKTPYWQAVSAKIRSRDKYKCSLCGATNNLCVHHKSYEHHGNEAEWLEDLTLLCDSCHTKFHGVEEN